MVNLQARQRTTKRAPVPLWFNLAAAQPGKVVDLLKKLEAWEKPFPAPRSTEREKCDAIRIKNHIGPPRYQGPGSSAVVDQE